MRQLEPCALSCLDPAEACAITKSGIDRDAIWRFANGLEVVEDAGAFWPRSRDGVGQYPVVLMGQNAKISLVPATGRSGCKPHCKEAPSKVLSRAQPPRRAALTLLSHRVAQSHQPQGDVNGAKNLSWRGLRQSASHVCRRTQDSLGKPTVRQFAQFRCRMQDIGWTACPMWTYPTIKPGHTRRS